MDRRSPRRPLGTRWLRSPGTAANFPRTEYGLAPAVFGASGFHGAGDLPRVGRPQANIKSIRRFGPGMVFPGSVGPGPGYLGFALVGNVVEFKSIRTQPGGFRDVARRSGTALADL